MSRPPANSFLQRIGSDTLVYGVGGFLAGGLNFIFLPIYTRLFAPDVYGLIEMLVVVSTFLRMLMYMSGAHSFYVMKEKSKGVDAQAEVITSFFQLRFLWGGSVLILGLLLLPPMAPFLFNAKISSIGIVLACLSALLIEFAGQPLEIFRLTYRPWPYVLLHAGRSLVVGVLTIGLAVLYKPGIQSYFAALICGSFVIAIVGWFFVRSYLRWSRLFSSWWPTILRFALPLVPFQIGAYVLESADRWFILRYNGEDVVGLYAVAARFGMAIAMLIRPLRAAWFPVAMEALHSEKGATVYRQSSVVFLGIGSMIVVLLTLASKTVVTLLTAQAYHAAYPLVGLIAWQWLLHGFHMICSGGILQAEKTYLSSFVIAAAVAANLLLNYLLVPRFGPLGAASASILVYAMWVTAVLIIAEKQWHVGYPYVRLLLIVLIGIASSVGIIAALWFDISPYLPVTCAVVAVGLIALLMRRPYAV